MDNSDPKIKLAAALLSLNMNYESQTIWNYIARLLYDLEHKASAFQCINMGKVFAADDELNTAKHAITLWYKIMLDVSSRQPTKEQMEGVEQVLNNLRGVGIRDNLFVRDLELQLTDVKRKVFLRDCTTHKNLEQVGGKISQYLEAGNIIMTLKALNLWMIMALKADTESQDAVVAPICEKIRAFWEDKEKFTTFRGKYYTAINLGLSNPAAN